MLWVAVLGAGIATGLWMASITSYCALCVAAPPRFATWQCCIAGLAVSAVGFGVTTALSRAFLPASVGGIRRASRFLFEDLARRQTD